MRAEAEALVLIQQTLQWYTATVGETSIQAETYLGHDRLFSRESIARVRKAAQAPGIGADERRAREFFQAYLAGEFLSQSTAKFDDRAQNAALKATVRLPWMKEPVPYKQLDLLVADEKDAGRRAEIDKARAEIWRRSSGTARTSSSPSRAGGSSCGRSWWRGSAFSMPPTGSTGSCSRR
jgi:hypothetical protein